MNSNDGLTTSQIAEREIRVKRLMTCKMVISGNSFTAGQAAHAIGRNKRKESYTREQGKALCEYLERIGELESHSDGKKVVYFIPSTVDLPFHWAKPNDIKLGMYFGEYIS